MPMSWNLFANTLKDMGIECRFVDPSDPQNFARAVDDKTRAFYAETLPNPKLEVFPIKEVADIGRPLGIPLIWIVPWVSLAYALLYFKLFGAEGATLAD